MSLVTDAREAHQQWEFDRAMLFQARNQLCRMFTAQVEAIMEWCDAEEQVIAVARDVAVFREQVPRNPEMRDMVAERVRRLEEVTYVREQYRKRHTLYVEVLKSVRRAATGMYEEAIRSQAREFAKLRWKD